MIHRLCSLIGGLYQLLRLGVLTRFSFKGEYWQWRLHTAFGRGYPASKVELYKSILEYGIWMHEMKR